jgi:hypothetical protein
MNSFINGDNSYSSASNFSATFLKARSTASEDLLFRCGGNGRYCLFFGSLSVRVVFSWLKYASAVMRHRDYLLSAAKSILALWSKKSDAPNDASLDEIKNSNCVCLATDNMLFVSQTTPIKTGVKKLLGLLS